MTEPRRAFVDEFDTPIGRFTVVVRDGGGLHAVGWRDGRERLGDLKGEWELIPRADPFGVVSAFRAYFEGELNALDALTLAAECTDFQLEVWRALREIPCGETRSYRQLSQTIGRPKAVRAVGLANGANPLPVVVPCHRVIGADGSLTGYGGGLHRKRWLLAHERRRAEGELDLGGG